MRADFKKEERKAKAVMKDAGKNSSEYEKAAKKATRFLEDFPGRRIV